MQDIVVTNRAHPSFAKTSVLQMRNLMVNYADSYCIKAGRVDWYFSAGPWGHLGSVSLFL